MFRLITLTSTARHAGRALAVSSAYTRQPVRSLLARDLPQRILPSMIHTQAVLRSSADTALKQEEKVEDIVQEIVEEQPQAQAKLFKDQAINPLTLKALDRVFKYKEMSVVQDAVCSRLPIENDIFVKAKTGTGKTLAFLIAALERAYAGKTIQDLKHFEGTKVFIISPTRELALQIANEAERLLKFYPLGVHCMVGGERKGDNLRKLERLRCDVVVGTPGRLFDLLDSAPRFHKMCQSTEVLILDEADQLLDMGFKNELRRILDKLPSENRQTMLFSATLSNDIHQNLGKFALSPKYDLIDTVGKEETNTHLHVKQSALVAPFDEHPVLLRAMLQDLPAAVNGKTIVFLPTTKSTIAYAQLLKFLLPDRNVLEIHSKKSQEQRTKISKRFRNARAGTVLVTSDVSARGVDYPGVSLVVQLGVPTSREQYIHRLGRTGRAGAQGEGVLIMDNVEQGFVRNALYDLPVQKLQPPPIDEEERETTNRLRKYVASKLDDGVLEEAFTAFLGYYAGRADMLNVKKSEIVEAGSKFALSLGAVEPPSVSQNFLARIGLVDKPSRYGSNNNNRRRFDDFARFDRGGHRRDSFNSSGRRNFDRGNDRFDRNQDRFDRPRRNDRNDRFRSDRSDRSDRSERAPRRDRFENDAPALKPSGRKWGSDSF
ncbi:P-loop containing nucleoside triphosphate hydrolase protein [Syncephalastrum racemosum]|uniref:ATP-dependent RNA helicase n=1 Tax=Syncephalastrum racemosum TaxID=13706 RepID=A0A1X2GZV0_SYNRA|nr:P-loop containing nucleoside triphosphate hydrolase protein [Syncephalastrum racemosum]